MSYLKVDVKEFKEIDIKNTVTRSHAIVFTPVCLHKPTQCVTQNTVYLKGTQNAKCVTIFYLQNPLLITYIQRTARILSNNKGTIHIKPQSCIFLLYKLGLIYYSRYFYYYTTKVNFKYQLSTKFT